MFERISKAEKENEKKIEAIKANITKAQQKIDKLKEGLSFDTDMDQYSDFSMKISAYKEFIKTNEEQLKIIKASPYTHEDCVEVRESIQKEYNDKFKKAYADVLNQLDKVFISFDNYKKITDEFIDNRGMLNLKASEIKSTCHVYEGEGIRNDYYYRYIKAITMLKNISEINKLT